MLVVVNIRKLHALSFVSFFDVNAILVGLIVHSFLDKLMLS